MDLLQAISADMAASGLDRPSRLRVDGGMTANHWLMQYLADVTDMPVEVAAIAETTALGAAFHAGRAAGLYASEEELSRKWRSAQTFEPTMGAAERDRAYGGWTSAVERVRSGSGS